ncbi:MFS family permease [Bradyrhizobium elkanii]
MRNPAARYDLQPSGTTTVERALDALNFFLADVRDGLGPYLAIYLLTERKWDEASIGSVMSIAATAGILAQTPAGALIDRSPAKRGLMIAAAIAVTAACLLLPLLDRFELLAATQALAAASGSVFAPAIAAVTLGIVGPKAFAARTGRNEAFNHAGNAVAAAIAGGTAYWFGPVVVFWLLAAMALASIAATLSIPPTAIDHEVARGLDDMEEHGASQDRPSGFRVLLTYRPLLIFAVSTVIFHFANAAMLPLVGQKLALVNRNLGTSLMSVCIIAAQIVMVPVAMRSDARLTSGVASRSSLWRSRCWRSVARSIRCRTTRTGWCRCNCSTASAPGSSARCSRSWLPISRTAPGISTSARARSPPRPASAPR